jgi:hypothetical protein
MLISDYERFRQEINADQGHAWVSFFQLILDRTKPIPSFWSRKLKYEPHKSFIFQNKLIPWFLSKVWNKNEHFRLVFAKMLVFLPKTGLLNASTGVGCRSTFSIVGAQLCLPALYCRHLPSSEKNFLLDECYEIFLNFFRYKSR